MGENMNAYLLSADDTSYDYAIILEPTITDAARMPMAEVLEHIPESQEWPECASIRIPSSEAASLGIKSLMELREDDRHPNDDLIFSLLRLELVSSHPLP